MPILFYDQSSPSILQLKSINEKVTLPHRPLPPSPLSIKISQLELPDASPFPKNHKTTLLIHQI